MTHSFQYPTEYFLQEGKENLVNCLQKTFDAALAHKIEKIIIFTSAGKGILMALREYCTKAQYSHIKLIAVTFPNQAHFTAGDSSDHFISDEDRRVFEEEHVPIVRAHLPFHPIRSQHTNQGVLGQDFGLIDNALRIFGGGMSLCVQAVLMASDAGYVALGEHVLAMASDTSILVRAAGTERFLTDLIVREVVCKPVLLTVGKSEDPSKMIEGDARSPRELPSSQKAS